MPSNDGAHKHLSCHVDVPSNCETDDKKKRGPFAFHSQTLHHSQLHTHTHTKRHTERRALNSNGLLTRIFEFQKVEKSYISLCLLIFRSPLFHLYFVPRLSLKMRCHRRVTLHRRERKKNMMEKSLSSSFSILISVYNRIKNLIY